ncbi:hypothetical protein PT279_02725 [Bifidobacterium sp. ESL0784]|uniref:hypothetical protein n=1 Tax=Bifidobacterium sp. ESL0784 TaxID=2983231 RepID=UPI0023F8FAE1|nr:hypothetical protein [Bifidobacterium sp. ESL0784]MDF7640506.1 hypothetical protein [Bifidobacterium sp. ESL0784]
MAAQITALFKTDGSKAQQAAQRSGDKDITVDAEQNPMRGAGFHSISITQNGYTIRIRDFDVSDKYATHGKGIDIIGFNMHRKNDTDTGAGMKLSNDSVSIDQDDCKDFLSHTGLKQKQAEHMCEQSLQYLLNTLADNW